MRTPDLPFSATIGSLMIMRYPVQSWSTSEHPIVRIFILKFANIYKQARARSAPRVFFSAGLPQARGRQGRIGGRSGLWCEAVALQIIQNISVYDLNLI